MTANSTEIARETLRLLASRRIAPTPENYRRIYHEIAGVPEETGASSWPTLIRELLRLWEIRHSGFTTARKRESLDKILGSESDPARLHQKLSGLLRSWAELRPSQEESLVDAEGKDLPLQAPAPAAKDDSAALKPSREPRDEEDIEVQEGLARLLGLLVENVDELLAGDPWLHGQITVVRELIAARPLDGRAITEAERGLKEVIFRQSTLKPSLNEAKTALKNMLSEFVGRLQELSESTGEYHEKISLYSEKIRQTDDIGQLGSVLEAVMRDTRSIQASALRSREELAAARQRAEAAERKIRELETELCQASEMVRADQLTGALNRRGLDEAFARESARADRHGSLFSVALLDVDNFKQLNDTYGHQAGDEALVHLVGVIRHILRPSDQIARFGGEEFLILLPDTGLEEAVKTMERLQRELTKRFFLSDNRRVLITFSAGVSLRANGEPKEAAIARADQALYQAKRSGKNRVCCSAA